MCTNQHYMWYLAGAREYTQRGYTYRGGISHTYGKLANPFGDGYGNGFGNFPFPNVTRVFTAGKFYTY